MAVAVVAEDKLLCIDTEVEERKSELRIVGETYAVEKIVGIKVIETGEKLYKVRWKGFSESEDTWEPFENLTDGCDRLILEYETSQKNLNLANNEDHSRASTSRSHELSENSSDRSSIRHAHGSHWEYETVEVLTPDEWNRFGNVENRELGGLYIPDRIPSVTEKILCNLAPDLGRVTRNKLKTVMKTESSPSKETSPTSTKRAVRKGRGQKAQCASTSAKKSIQDGRRSFIKEESEKLENSGSVNEKEEIKESPQPLLPTVPLKAEVPDDVLLSHLSKESPQIAAGDTSAEGGENLSVPTKRGKSTKRKRPAKRSGGRGRPKKRLASGKSKERTVSSVNLEEQEQSNSAEVLEVSFLIASKRETEAATSGNISGSSYDGELMTSYCTTQGVSRSGRRTATGGRRKQSTTPGRKTPSKLRGTGRTGRARKRKASTNADENINKEESTGAEIPKGTQLLRAVGSNDRYDANDESGESEMEISALELITCETPELPIPLTNAFISTINHAVIRKDQQNRERPLQTFEQFRNAVLANQISVVKWTGRCVPERRGFDFNQKYRGKTVAIELCERPCGPAHETDEMLRQIVRGGARLDIPDDTRGRIPLHYAISCEFWCRVKILLHLRSPVNTEDKDKKTPLQLVLLTRMPSFEVTKTIYLLLEYGADVNELIRKLAPLRNRYVTNLIEHQQRLSQAFDEARMKTLVDITVKRILLPVTVRAMWEFESNNRTTEIGFNHETFLFPNLRYAYMILLGVFDYRSARYWRVRMWGESPFVDVQMNDVPAESLTNTPNGFVYVTSLLNGWNKLKIRFQPFVKKKKWLAMAQVLLVQLHKPPHYIPRPALEVAPESGTDWRHD